MRITHSTIVTILLSLSAFLTSAVADESWRGIISEWRDANAGISTGTADPRRVESATANLRAWLAQASGNSGFEADARAKLQSEMLNFPIAEAWSHAGDFQKAMSYLKAEIAELQNTKGGFLNNSRNPDWFAVEVFLLHSEIMAHTGDVGPISGAGYEVFAVSSPDGKSRFAFVYMPCGDSEREFKIEGIADGEERRMIYLTEPEPSAKYRIVDRAEVVAKRDRFSVIATPIPDGLALVISGVTKVVEYKGEFGVPVVHPSPRSQIVLRLSQGNLEQPLQALAVAGSGQLDVEPPSRNLSPKIVPTQANSPQAPKAPEPKSSNAGGSAPIHWLVWSMMVVAAIGLLYVVIRNWK